MQKNICAGNFYKKYWFFSWWVGCYFFAALIVRANETDLGLNSTAAHLFQDLKVVAQIDEKQNDSLPLFVNYQLQGGYFTMPSARTYPVGWFGCGYSFVAPYNIWSVSLQFFNRLETTGNYWVYRRMLDENFGHLGFGDYAERAANVKCILLRKEDGVAFLPEVAIGWNDFLGSCRFRSFYVAATQEFLPFHCEATLGWGCGRIQGMYGGFAWTPWKSKKLFVRNITVAAEYDANNYRYHQFEHPEGRKVKSRINAGVQMNFWDFLRVSTSSLRGTDWALSAQLTYPLGSSQGFFPKMLDPSVYSSPIHTEPLGVMRSREQFAQELAEACKEQGFDLYTLFLVPDITDHLWMKVINVRYREESVVRSRLQALLSSLSPSHIADITVAIEADGVVEHEYRFRLQDLQKYAHGTIGENEFAVIAPLREASPTPSPYDAACLYQRNKKIWMMTFRPWTQTFFGSSTGKFKYEVGLSLGPEGYLFNQIYYSIYGSYTAFSSTQGMRAQDFLNPSRIINVRTDSLLYNQASSFHIDQAFVQKSMNWGKGIFSRLALGYFETAYAGVAAECLYYPVQCNWAVGCEIATLLKRGYFGMGFQKKIRKLTREGPKFFPFTGLQYFIDLYYQYHPLHLDFKISIGQFLARDKGARLEVGRTFASGLRVALWYTPTTANDVVNGERYYDKGFSITVPLDLFMNQTSRTRVGYAMAAWLRDCGARAHTGKALYPTLYWERYQPYGSGD